MHLDKSAELRAIRFALEKSRGKDVIEFLLKTKEMISTTLSLNWGSFFMDEQHIEPGDLSQIFSAIYDGKSVSKTHLLAGIQNRCDLKGISAGELAAMLLVDFMKAREKEELGSPKRKEQGGETHGRTKEKFALSYGGRDSEGMERAGGSETGKGMAKSGLDMESPTRAMTERKLKEKSGYDWNTSKAKTLSERKAVNTAQIKKEQKKTMM